jgi:hypothetical protein
VFALARGTWFGIGGSAATASSSGSVSLRGVLPLPEPVFTGAILTRPRPCSLGSRRRCRGSWRRK